jgi:hypothetical protein
MPYYKGLVKIAHVGTKKCLDFPRYVRADSPDEATKLMSTLHGAKKGHANIWSILNLRPVSEEKYYIGKLVELKHLQRFFGRKRRIANSPYTREVEQQIIEYFKMNDISEIVGRVGMDNEIFSIGGMKALYDSLEEIVARNG